MNPQELKLAFDVAYAKTQHQGNPLVGKWENVLEYIFLQSNEEEMLNFYGITHQDINILRCVLLGEYIPNLLKSSDRLGNEFLTLTFANGSKLPKAITRLGITTHNYGEGRGIGCYSSTLTTNVDEEFLLLALQEDSNYVSREYETPGLSWILETEIQSTHSRKSNVCDFGKYSEFENDLKSFHSEFPWSKYHHCVLVTVRNLYLYKQV
jgi:hypothetical protein